MASSSTASRWHRANLWVHRWAGLVATLPFLILCLTGTVLIFHDEVDSAMGVLPPAPGIAVASRPMDASVQNVLANRPGEKVMFVGIDEEDHPGLLLLATVPNGQTGFKNDTLHFTNIATGELAKGSGQSRTTLTGFLLELHAQWFLGPLGELIGAVIALLVFAALISGLVVYAPHARRVAFGVVRRGRGTRLLQLDLHNLIGVVVLGWALVVTVTGFLLGFGTIATGIWSQQTLAAVSSHQSGAPVNPRSPPVDVDAAARAALTTAPPGWKVTSIIWPGSDLSTRRHYTVLVGGEGLNKQLFQVVQVDAATGKASAPIELPWYMKAITLSQPLHFGDYGGLTLKLLWTACTWLTLFITGNGAWLWWNRRRQRRTRTTR